MYHTACLDGIKHKVRGMSLTPRSAPTARRDVLAAADSCFYLSLLPVSCDTRTFSTSTNAAWPTSVSRIATPYPLPELTCQVFGAPMPTRIPWVASLTSVDAIADVLPPVAVQRQGSSRCESDKVPQALLREGGCGLAVQRLFILSMRSHPVQVDRWNWDSGVKLTPFRSISEKSTSPC